MAGEWVLFRRMLSVPKRFECRFWKEGEFEDFRWEIGGFLDVGF